MNAYISLSRLDRPIGVLLLYLLPCWWGITLAAPEVLNLKLLFLFAIGVILVRGAGCTFNDMIDRNIDSQVERTKMRPLASGTISPFHAFIFFGLQGIGGLTILVVFLPQRCWPLSLVQLALMTLYPFMKRITYWPQLVLGFAMNFGVIFGAVAAAPYESLNWPALISLYAAGIAWTMGYDTIYALQDKEEDLKIGVKSTAIRFGNRIKPAVALSYVMMFILLANVGYLSGGGRVYYAILALGILIVTRQLYFLNPTNPAQCQKIFASPYLGWLVWGALLALSM